MFRNITLVIITTFLILGLLPAQLVLAEQVYRVGPGDNLKQIAWKNGTTTEEIRLFNPFVEQLNHIYTGQILILPEQIPPQEPAVEQEKEISHEPLTEQPVIKPKPKSNYQYNAFQLLNLFPTTYFLTGKPDQKVVALTFDDGPDEIYTGQILDILARHNIKATFFLIGALAEQHPSVVSAIVNSGHLAANHSWSHSNLRLKSADEVKNELLDTTEAIKNVTGLEPLLFRPPYGEMSPEGMDQANQLGYTVAGWSVDSKDWQVTSAGEILVNTLTATGRGSIILMHSAGSELDDTLEALPDLIYTLKAQGFEFVTLDKLLDRPAYRY